MNWFYIALIGPVLYAISNHIDKYLLEKYFKGGEAGALVIFSALFSIVALPIIYLIDPAVFSLGIVTILILLVNGALTIICLILYFKALRDEEASVVIPFYQTIPIFGFILGYIILGETLNANQVLACSLIIIGTIIISLNFSDGKIKIRKRAAALMLLASFLYAVGGVIFKMIAIEEGFWTTIFWDFSGKVLLGMILFVFAFSYRRQFFQVMELSRLRVLSLNSFNEIIFIIAEGTFAYASLLAPIALVMTVNGLQPLFVFLIGIIMTILYPSLVSESLSKKNIAQKVLAIVIITIGTYMLGISGAL